MRPLILALLCLSPAADSFAAAGPDTRRASVPTRPKGATLLADAHDLLISFGVSLAQSPAGLRVLHVRKGSSAAKLGLRPRDTLLTLNGRRVRRTTDAAKALRSWKSETRLSAVVSRIDDKFDDAPPRPDLRGELMVLEMPPLLWPRPESRDAALLTPGEEAIRDAHLEAAREASERPLEALKAPGFKVAAGERVWIRFPKGIAQSVQVGDVLEGETSTSMASDSSLDFIVIPQGSRVWAAVAASSVEGRARVVQLSVFKIALAGGRSYPCAAVLRSIADADRGVQISAGGSLVAAPEDADPFLLNPERNLQIEFREDLLIREREDFYRAGPGLWLRSTASGNGRTFEVSHVIAGRSAHAYGIREGDRVTHIDGRPVYRLGFSEAIRRLYGSVGTNVELKLLSASDKTPRRVKLRRGAGYRNGYGLTLSAGKGGAYVLSVDEESPAYEAGIRRGHRIDAIDGTETPGLGKVKLNALLEPGDGKKLILFKPRDRKARTVGLQAVSYPYRRGIRERLTDFR